MPVLGDRHNRNTQPGFEWLLSDALQRTLRKETVVHSSDWSRWRTEEKKPRRTPPSNYEAILLSQAGSARMWNELQDDWHCPICTRPKHQTVKFQDRKVGFQTHAPTFRSTAWRHVPRVCMDCCAVVKSMTRELQKGFGATVNATFDSITPDQLLGIMTQRPYSTPLIDPIKAEALIKAYVRQIV